MARPLVQLLFWVKSKGEKLPLASEHYHGASCCSACVLRHARRRARRSVSQEAATGAGTAAGSLGFRPAAVPHAPGVFVAGLSCGCRHQAGGRYQRAPLRACGAQPAWPLFARPPRPPPVPVCTQSLFHLRLQATAPRLLAEAYPRSRLEPSVTDPPGSTASAGQASTKAGSGGGKPVRLITVQIYALRTCREQFRSAPAWAGGPAVFASCLAQQIAGCGCHVLQTLLASAAAPRTLLQ